MTWVTVIIVNYKAADLILRNLPNVTAEKQGVERLDVIIVDNASPDDSLDVLKARIAGLDHVELIASPVNGGFAAGNNVGFRAIYARDEQPDAVLLLNPDTEFFPGSLHELLSAAEAFPKGGCFGGKAFTEEMEPRGCCYRYPRLLREASAIPGLYHVMPERIRSVEMLMDAEGPAPCDWVSGACFLLTRKALQDVPFFDEGYFLYFEETDYCRELNRHGWQVIHVPSAKFVHVGGQSTGINESRTKKNGLPSYWYDSWRRYHVKTHGRFHTLMTGATKLLASLLKSLRSPGGAQGGFSRADFIRLVMVPTWKGVPL
ncbi:MAG: glycosyltransferase family 2 protein [Pseudomonadota bacterium]